MWSRITGVVTKPMAVKRIWPPSSVIEFTATRRPRNSAPRCAVGGAWASGSSDTTTVFQTTSRTAGDLGVPRRPRIRSAGPGACDDTGVPSVPGRVVIVSHAGVLSANRAVYGELAGRGVGVELVVPAAWRNEYAPGGFAAHGAGGLLGHVHPTRVVGEGRPQRHAYLARAARVLAALGATTVLIEEEPFSVAAVQWSRAARRRRVPYGVQVAETLDRPMPRAVVRWRTRVAGAR